MIDLHCHLLPGVDDGPASWDAALDLARALVADGVRVVTATPHSSSSPKSRRHQPAELQSLTEELRSILREQNIPLSVTLGHELYLTPDLVTQLRAGSVLSYPGSRLVLLESPFASITDSLERVIFELQVAGFRVLLAHPERIKEVQHDPNRLLSLVRKGVYLQITAGSLIGQHGSQLQATAEALVGSHMCHVLASDAHTASGRRAPYLRQALVAASNLIGQPAAEALVTTTPQALLHDQPVQLPEPRPFKPRKRFKWLPFF